MTMDPIAGSMMRNRASVMDDLPAPVLPTIPTFRTIVLVINERDMTILTKIVNYHSGRAIFSTYIFTQFGHFGYAGCNPQPNESSNNTTFYNSCTTNYHNQTLYLNWPRTINVGKHVQSHVRLRFITIIIIIITLFRH